MIHKLRWRFIRVAMLSVSLVLALLILAVNGINLATTHGDLSRLLAEISDNGGAVPGVQDRKPEGWGRTPITVETPFSTRYFVLRYTPGGTLLSADMSHIAAVTEDDAAVYLEVALRHGEGQGYKGSYIFEVSHPPGRTDEYQAVFLNCQQQLRALRTYAIGSLGAAAGCLVLVYILLLVFSKKALGPTVESIRRQKQFITDASHELKTPLTVISTSQKVLEMEVGHQKWIDKTMAQVEKLRGLVDELVTLSRLDEDQPPMRLTCFDASDAVAETAESFLEYAEEQGKALVLDVPEGITFWGDQLALRQLTSVLVDNAVKYSTDGGTIRLSLRETKKGVLLQVTNPCQPISSEELPRLFDRFYRTDKSRSRQTGGFGVGLSIARSIAETHHGQIRAACPEEGTIVFTAQLHHMKKSSD